MKKLLTLLMAFLLFAPPRANAETKFATIYDIDVAKDSTITVAYPNLSAITGDRNKNELKPLSLTINTQNIARLRYNDEQNGTVIYCDVVYQEGLQTVGFNYSYYYSYFIWPIPQNSSQQNRTLKFHTNNGSKIKSVRIKLDDSQNQTAYYNMIRYAQNGTFSSLTEPGVISNTYDNGALVLTNSSDKAEFEIKTTTTTNATSLRVAKIDVIYEKPEYEELVLFDSDLNTMNGTSGVDPDAYIEYITDNTYFNGTKIHTASFVYGDDKYYNITYFRKRNAKLQTAGFEILESQDVDNLHHVSYNISEAYPKTLTWESDTKLRFTSDCGQIHKVEMTLCFTPDYNFMVENEDDVEISHNDDNTVWTFTLKPGAASDEIVVWHGETQPVLGQSYREQFKKIVVSHSALNDPIPPKAPELKVFPGFGYKYDKDKQTLEIPTFPRENAENHVAAYIDWGTMGTEVYYTFNPDLPLPNSQILNPEDADASKVWVRADRQKTIRINTGIKFASVIPTDENLDNTTFKIRAICYSAVTGKISNLMTVNCKTYRMPGLELDLEEMAKKNTTAADFEFDDETHTLYFTGYNPRIILKNPDGIALATHATTGYYVKYNTAYIRMTPSLSDPDIKTYDSNVHSTGIEIKNGTADRLPVAGQHSQLNLLSYVRVLETIPGLEQVIDYYDKYSYAINNNTIILVESRNPDEGANRIPVAAPSVEPAEHIRTLTLSGAVGYIEDRLPVTFHSRQNWGTEAPGKMQYQWVENGFNVLEPPTDNWIDATGNEIPAKSTGRLFVREFKNNDIYSSHTAYFDFRYIETNPLNNVAYTNLLNIDDKATVVHFTRPLRVVGFFPFVDDSGSDDNPVYLMFVADEYGNVLRVHVESTDEEFINTLTDAYNKFYLIDGLTGELHKNKEMPELWLANATINFTDLISQPYKAPDNFAKYEPEFVQRVPVISDYSKLMYFGPLRWNQTDRILTDNNGNTVKLYPRLATNPSATEIEDALVEGVQYRIAGYVGFAEGAPVILPRAYVASPLLRAPNPINNEAMPEEMIDMNVISSSLELTVNPRGVGANTTLDYFICNDNTAVAENDSRWATAKSIDALTGTIDVNTAKSTTLAARLSAGTMHSGVVTVHFNKIEAMPVENIAQFKEFAGNLPKLPKLSEDIDDETHTFYQYKGYARIREVTPNYIYIRTVNKNGNLLDDMDAEEEELTEEIKKNRSDNSILIYNAEGWDYDIVTLDNKGNPVPGTRTPLKRGDLITNFALIPTESGFGNLIANATGFIRTFRRSGDTENTTNPIVINAQADNVPRFTESDRMLRYSIRNVTVSRKENTEFIGALSDESFEGPAGDVPSAPSYIYTLDLPGKPILNNGDVYAANPDWDIIWSESTMFNLAGVVMLYDGNKKENEDGRYMLALNPDSIGVSGVETPRAPRIRLNGVESAKGSFVIEATVTLVSSTAQENDYADIWYTTDGTDPRQSNSTRKKYTTGGFTIRANTVVRAYVRSNGTPNSELAEAVFTRSDVEARYIVNFLTQAQKDTPYHLSATTKVVAKGGDYFFIRGTQGHYLPIKDETKGASIVNKIKVGEYYNDMIITPHFIGTVIRGAHIEDEHSGFFGKAIPKPANIDDIAFEPDEVTTITTANARRYVKIMGVKLTGEEFNAEDEISTHDTQWKLTTNRGENGGKDIRVNHTVLKYEIEKDDDPTAYYNVTGFAMIGEDGQIELWPTAVEKVRTPAAVTARFTNALNGSDKIQADGNYDVLFYPHATVRLSCVQGASIYYYISDTEADETHKTEPWNLYAQPFAITKSCYIHAYSVAPGYEESGHTHIYMTLDGDQDPSRMSGELSITCIGNDEDGVPVVRIEPVENLKEGTYSIYYTTDGKTPAVDAKNLYTGEFKFPGGIVLAILKEAGKALPGRVASLNVWYMPTAIGGIGSDGTGNTGIRVEGGNIIAPEGSEVYDLNGRRVRPEALGSGIYIVRIPGSPTALKIKVN